MADYGARWNMNNMNNMSNLNTADRGVPSPPAKRARRDFGYEDRSAWGNREGEQQVTASSNGGLPGYGSLSADLINAVTSSLGLGAANAFAALDDPTLVSQTSQMMGYDVSSMAPAAARPPNMNMNMNNMNMNMNNLSNMNVNLNPQPPVDALPPDASSTLYVDGLPSDCTRREAAHIFRPFIGFKEVRLVIKDQKRVSNGDKLVFCFVEFVDAKCAATALEALQGTHVFPPFPLLVAALGWNHRHHYDRRGGGGLHGFARAWALFVTPASGCWSWKISLFREQVLYDYYG